MPGSDTRGPAGTGPASGGGRGPCGPAGESRTDLTQGSGRGGCGRDLGRRMGLGRGPGCFWGAGRGFGRRRFAWRPERTTAPNPAEELRYGESEARILEQCLENAKKRIQELDAVE